MSYPYFCLSRSINVNVITIARNSATTIDDHIPSTPKMSGKIKTHTNWNTKQRQNEMIADINPLFNPVKKDDPNIVYPVKK